MVKANCNTHDKLFGRSEIEFNDTDHPDDVASLTQYQNLTWSMMLSNCPPNIVSTPAQQFLQVQQIQTGTR
jgi:hypothetical protein